MKILLSSVFGPYGVDDDYGRKENVMELFHNQVTREQGIFSLRYHHQSFGLYFLAENIHAPTTILDFPSEQRFVQELKKGYDYVGLSFIIPNFIKAQRMAQLVRKHAPESKIILGGHGTSIPAIEEKIDADYICRGEGVYWLRQLLGEDPDRPLSHPVLPSSFSNHVAGVPLKTKAAVLVPGVGCPNACRFCATAHFFEKKYTPYFDTGAELFEICQQIEEEGGYQEFFVMDENFLKRPQRARELLELMEEQGKEYRFGIFSSAEAISQLGVEFLVRLGVYFLWIGVESKKEVYEKNKGIDLQSLIRELRSHGITVLASGILFAEHHDKETIWEDIEYLVQMDADFVQFMQLGPFPGTALYQHYERQGILRHDIPYEEWHGQHRIWFDHPHFTKEETEELLRAAFRYDYDCRGAGILHMLDTAIRGYRTLARYNDEFIQRRRAYLKKWAHHLRPLLPALLRHAHNPQARTLAEQIALRYKQELGPMTLKERLLSQGALLYASLEASRVGAGKHIYQPRPSKTRYRMTLSDLVAEHFKGKNPLHRLQLDISWSKEPILLRLSGTLDRVNSRRLARKLKAYLKHEEGVIWLNLEQLEAIEDNALQRLLLRMRRYHKRIHILLNEEAQQLSQALEDLPQDIATLFLDEQREGI